MLPKKHRYQSRKEIDVAFNAGQWQHSQFCSLLIYKNPQRLNMPWRLTVIVGKKKVAKLATKRNLVKRQLTNAFYLVSQQFKLDGWDFCLVSKKTILITDFKTIIQEMTKFLS